MLLTNNMKSNSRLVRVEGSVKQAVEVSRTRLLFVAVIFCLSFVALSIRVMNLSLSDKQEAKTKVAAIDLNSEIRMKRRDIVDRNGVILATNLKTASLYANPKVIIDVKEAVDGLMKVFPDFSGEKLTKILSYDKGFVWVKRNLHPKEQYAVNNLGIPGLYFAEEEKRSYPHANTASHILGMVGIDGEGLSGIEIEFNERLLSSTPSYMGNEDGPLELTIDIRVQDILRRELMKEYKDHKAKGASGIILDVDTGEVIAMVSLPDFDPNKPSETKAESTFNYSTLGVYEMGSTFKAFTMAMALDSGMVSLKDAYDATSPIKVAGYTISDFHAKNRWLSVPEILMYSSNIGAARIGEQVGHKVQKKFLANLGLLDSLKIELPEKSRPIYPVNWGRINTMTISYGHGIAVTPMHVASAAAALVNGGTFRDVTLIKGNEDKKGIRVLKQGTSDSMRKLLRLVVESGTGRAAGSKGYLVGGKTGTAEKAGKDSYDKKALISSFIGAFPMNNPRYVVMTMIDEPKGNAKSNWLATSGYTAAPVVSNVIAEIAPMLGIKPVDESSPEIENMFHVNYTPEEHKLASF